MGNDADRYRRFLDGDDDELVVIINTYYQGLALYLNSIVKNICEAEEIMQETFVKLAVKKPKFNGKSTFKTWLYAIARNCAFNHLREKSRYEKRPIDEAFQLSDETDIEQQYLMEERKIQLHTALKKLHPEYAQVLYLKYFEDFDTVAIAKILKKSKRQVGDLTYRAKNALKHELERMGFVYEER
ncbi:MAG: sigma-70 family RNA polymerase sigma factor [Oscillospiraceae bacterium]|nr:sigma-70 family RNA polymerase sigma factor [Oscillospiraceae bacterium]